jgi:hypothetical protein
MTTTKQTFPPVTIEALPNGLFRLEDDSAIDGTQVIDMHPVQVQTLALMVGFRMPDKARAALGRVLGRVRTLHGRASDLEAMLRYALEEQDIDVAPELAACEFIASNLGEVVKDLEDLKKPEIEPMADAPANAGGQLTLPV